MLWQNNGRILTTHHVDVTWSNFSTKDSDSDRLSVFMLFRANAVKFSGL